MLAFNKQINASIIDPNFIATVRKKLALDQQEAAELFGGGVRGFPRKHLPDACTRNLGWCNGAPPQIPSTCIGGEFFGVGKFFSGNSLNAFSRYETGKTKPPLALIRLFQVLDLHPNLLSEIQALELPR